MDEVLLPSKESALINVCQHAVIFMFIQAGVEHTATLCYILLWSHIAKDVNIT